ncbi:MAG TPA: carboxypeptidase M32 [Gemmatimonadales bacterium]|nr:carboxypeptidase M32 [Gemmatimonadales bacterium]
MKPEAAYDELIRRSREETLLASCADVLEWDEETCLPRGGVAYRSEQLALLAGLLHDRGADPRLGELLDLLEASFLSADPESAAAVNIREIRRAYERERRLPRRLVEEIARVTALAQQAWADARDAGEYERFRPWLERIVRLAREEAEAVGYTDTPYDALLEDYEPGVTTREVARLFEDLRRELVPLVQAASPSGRRRTAVLRREYPVDRQRLFAEAVAAAIGFDLDRGRIDTAAHPFCTALGPGDCRITTRFAARDFPGGFFTVLHEVGHALYEQGLDSAHYGTPMGEPASLGLHESQSRLWENLVGRSAGFWRQFFPRARAVFHEALHDVKQDAFVAALNQVEPSLIRIGADEVTYNLHILIRFELEQALLADDLRPADLPEAWNSAYRATLGLTPANDRDGCLQDGHWGEGLIGYFPTYTLGNVYAAQLFAAAGRAIGDLDAQFGRGDFSGLLGWLREQVHAHGRRLTAARLIARATGAPPDWRPLVESLRTRYGESVGL